MKALFAEQDFMIPEWMDLLMESIDSNVIVELRRTDLIYAALKKTALQMQEQHPFLKKLMDENCELTLNKEDLGIFQEYMVIRNQIESRERQMFYRYGHTHCFEYLRKIGALMKDDDQGH